MPFGDDGPDDAYDPTGRADSEQVARRYHELRHERGLERDRFDDLTGGARATAAAIATALLAWMRREGTTP